jgi:hypothetical protein
MIGANLRSSASALVVGLALTGMAAAGCGGSNFSDGCKSTINETIDLAANVERLTGGMRAACASLNRDAILAQACSDLSIAVERLTPECGDGLKEALETALRGEYQF